MAGYASASALLTGQWLETISHYFFIEVINSTIHRKPPCCYSEFINSVSNIQEIMNNENKYVHLVGDYKRFTWTDTSNTFIVNPTRVARTIRWVVLYFVTPRIISPHQLGLLIIAKLLLKLFVILKTKLQNASDKILWTLIGFLRSICLSRYIAKIPFMAFGRNFPAKT